MCKNTLTHLHNYYTGTYNTVHVHVYNCTSFLSCTGSNHKNIITVLQHGYCAHNREIYTNVDLHVITMIIPDYDTAQYIQTRVHVTILITCANTHLHIYIIIIIQVCTVQYMYMYAIVHHFSVVLDQTTKI